MKKIVASVLLVISIIFLFKGFTDWKYKISNKVNNNSIRELVTSKNEEDPLNRIIDFQKLKSINKDVVAWIYIPGTKVDYPILVGESDEEYLYKNINFQYIGKGYSSTIDDEMFPTWTLLTTEKQLKDTNFNENLDFEKIIT